MRELSTAFFAIAALGLSACAAPAEDGNVVPGGGGKADGDDPSTAAWTVLVYGSYDTHDGGIPSSLREMQQRVSVDNRRIHLLYLEDLPGDANTKLWKVSARSAQLVEDEGELHLGDPDTLTTMLSRVYAKFPAEHVMVDLVGHTNSGVAGFLPDYTPASPSWERERMMYSQLRDAILASHVPVDVLALSGCGTGDLEIVARLADTAHYIVGLQEFNMGYTDVRWADSLARNADLSPASLARRMAEGMFKKAYYDQGAGGATGAYDATKMPAVKAALADLATTLTARLDANRADLVAARMATLQMKSEDLEFLVDARDFVDQLAANVHDSDVLAKADAFGAALDQLIIGGGAPSYADEAEHGAAHGLNVMFMRPGYSGRITDPSGFDQAGAWPAAETSFYEETGWRTFVTNIFASLPGGTP